MNRLILAIAALAIAAPAAHGATRAVNSGGLDLANSADGRVMLQRLDRAAADVCGASAFSVREMQRAVRRTACYRETMDQAVAALNAPSVSSLYTAGAQVAVR